MLIVIAFILAQITICVGYYWLGWKNREIIHKYDYLNGKMDGMSSAYENDYDR